MSSFVIGKAEYVKAAGAVAGIAQLKDLWVYDYQSNRNMTPEDYYTRFCECYEMNAFSVQEQYRDEVPERDGADYKALFKAYMNKGTSAAMSPEKLRNLIFELRQFFSSAEYQTEKEAYYFKMKMLFNEILVHLMGLLDYVSRGERKSWGAFNF